MPVDIPTRASGFRNIFRKKQTTLIELRIEINLFLISRYGSGIAALCSGLKPYRTPGGIGATGSPPRQ